MATDRDLHVAFGTAEAGTCGALRTQAIAVIDGREAITIEHVNRLAPDLGLEWGDRVDRPVYQVRIEGEPDVTCTMAASLRDPRASGSTMDAGAGAMVSTAMRVVNAIPYVVQAKPGLLTALEVVDSAGPTAHAAPVRAAMTAHCCRAFSGQRVI